MVAFAALTLTTPLFAQTPPRPAVRVSALARFEWGTWPADFNGDGKRDLGLITLTSIDIYPGNGDFTFGPQMSLPAAGESGPTQAIAVDLNGDARPDIVGVTSSQGCSNWGDGHVWTLLGNGDGTLQAPIDHDINALGSVTVVVGNLDGDGFLDAAPTSSRRLVRS